MAIVVGREMRQCAQREGVLVEILRLTKQTGDEVAGVDVVSQIAEERAAERIITLVLDDAPPVSVGVCLYQLIAGGSGKSFQPGVYGRIPKTESTMAS